MRNDRTSRTSVDLGNVRPSGPTVQSQLIERPTPQADASAGSAFGGLANAFNSFFNITAQEALSRSAEVAEAAKEREIIRLQAQAQRDYVNERPRDPQYADSDAYNKAFSAMVGDRDGRRVAHELTDFLNQLPLEEDAFEAGKAKLAEIYGEGTGDDTVDGLVFKYAQDAINGAVEERTTIRLGNQVQMRVDALGESIAEFAKSNEEWDTDSFNTWVQLYSRANPKEAPAARARVMDMILSSSNQNDRQLAALDRFLRKPGTGTNGKSFEESFPAAYDTMQQKLINARRTTGTLEALEAYKGIDERVAGAKTSQDLSALYNELSLTRDRYGEGAEYGRIRDNLIKAMDKLVETEVLTANLGAYIDGQGATADLPYDKDMRDLLPKVVKEAGGSVLTDDVNARQIASAIHLNLTKASDKTRDELGSALTGINERGRLQAYEFLVTHATMAAKDGPPDFKAVADKFLFGNETAKALFMRVAEADLVSDESLNELFSQYLGAPDFDSGNVSLANIDSNSSDAIASINDRIADVLGDHFDADSGLFGAGGFLGTGLGRDLDVEDIDPQVLRHLRDRFKFLWGRGGSRSDTWEADLDATTKAAIANLGVIVRDGRNVVTFSRPMRARSGGEFREVKPLSTQAQNPYTGEVVNTLGEARDTVSAAAEALGYDADQIGIEAGSQTQGYYPLRLGGDEPVFELGAETILPDGSKLVLSQDTDEAFAVLEERLGDLPGVGFEEVTLGGRKALRMFYRPLWDTPKDIARKRAETAKVEREKAARLLEDRRQLGNVAGANELNERALGIEPDVSEPSLLPTPDAMRRQILDATILQRRQEGRVAPSLGVTTPGPTSMEELDDMEKTYRNRVGIRATSPTYARNLYDFILDAEGYRRTAYDDVTGKSVRAGKVQGKVTVGVGFNMDADGARERFTKALPDVDFDAVYSGQERLTDAQVRRLFDATIEEYEKIVDSKVKDTPLTEHQRIALVSLAFNNPSLIGPNLTALIQSGDFDAAVEEILLRSNRTRHKGIQNRRVAEAQMFAGKANPLPYGLVRASYN